MKKNCETGIAGTSLFRIGGTAIRERRRAHATWYARQNPGTGVRFGADAALAGVVGGALGVTPTVRRMTADSLEKFWVPLCPQESAP
ncbi:hypothetical protein [Saccharomonospora piscinae]|uniref:Uncharacterized protein n=1 Tax=Saccharomonospora piscinae TaxID=687388 RepID=A0A1V8ZYB3_SACPI|nr:hypothetical protein [Saccharomonospora piscinae]OQO89790.1 hypothetical protein B1813_18150 [Saccharomonospora piscinae]TLW90555.1 hypothetical protein FFT09_19540 [Saccharomonospora piscinae]